MTRVLLRDTQRKLTERGEGHVTMEAETEMMEPHSKEFLVLEEARKSLPYSLWRGCSPAHTLLCMLGL